MNRQLFIHGGHTDKISDLTWSAEHDWVLASVADNNVVQVRGAAPHAQHSRTFD
jgi:hypothetical protein